MGDETHPIATIIICQSVLMSKKPPVFAFLVILGISFVNEIFEQTCVVCCVVLDVCNAMVSLTKNVI